MAAKKKNTETSEKKKETKKMSQAHGMVEKEKFQATSLNQVWGDDGTGKYRTLDLEEYQLVLGDMNKADMQAHATKIGLIPIDDMRMLRQRLVREFKVHVAQYTKPIVDSEKQTDLDQRARRTLSEGR